MATLGLYHRHLTTVLRTSTQNNFDETRTRTLSSLVSRIWSRWDNTQRGQQFHPWTPRPRPSTPSGPVSSTMTGCGTLQILVPHQLGPRVLSLVHRSAGASYRDNLQPYFSWPGYQQDVELYVHQFDICSAQKGQPGAHKPPCSNTS